MVKLVDTLDLGSSAARRGGSSPSIRTNTKANIMTGEEIVIYITLGGVVVMVLLMFAIVFWDL
jgi:hypothetical protein